MKKLLLPLLVAFAFMVGMVSKVEAQTYYAMSSGDYSQTFTNLSTSYPTNFNGLAVLSTGSIPIATKTTTATNVALTAVATSTALGYDAVSANSTKMVFMCSGSTDNSAAIACDLNLDFTGRTAGTLGFNYACILNSSAAVGRASTLLVYYSTDGSIWNSLGSAYTVYNTTGASTANVPVSITLPSALTNQSTVKIRFYEYNGGTVVGTPSGSRAKISLDDITVSSSAAATTPTLSTTAATGITTTGATLAGSISATGGATVSANGIVSILYTTNTNPTTATSGVTNTTATAVQSGAFSVSLAGLSVNTQYAYNAYATNSAGTSYGTASSFYTLANAPTTPTVGGATTSTLNVTLGASDGNPSTTTYAIYNSTTSNYVQANGSLGASAVYQTAATWGTVTVTGLSSGTSYSFSTYAKNGAGTITAASSAASASTTAASTPGVTTTSATSITTTSATLAGNVSSAGSSAVTANGIVSILYATNTNPTTATSGVTNTTATAVQSGAFTISLSGLSVNTQYAYNAYATNTSGSGYGTATSFYTLANTPTTPIIGSATATTLAVTIGANDGNPATTTYAIYSSNATKYVQADGSLNTTAVYQTAATWGTKTVTGLSSGTSYQFTVYAQNGAGTTTTASTAASASTVVALAPTLSTTAATNITTTSATLAGNISSAGTATITENGVVSILYASNNNPSTATSGVTKTIATTAQSGAYSVSLTGLLVNTQYAYNAYAINSVGTAYGTATSFYTLANAPTAPTLSAATTSTLGITIGASDGNPATTTYSIYCSTTSKYVQANGSLGSTAVYQTAATWATVTVTGLSAATSYSFVTYAQNGAGTLSAASTSATASTIAPALLYYNFFGVTGNTALAPVPASIVSGISVPAADYLTAGSAMTTAGSTTNSWGCGGSVSTLTANYYFQWGFTVSNGYSANISAVDLGAIRSSTTGGKIIDFQYSINGGATWTTIVTGAPIGVATGTSYSRITVNTASVTELQKIATGSDVRFRVYFYGASGTSGLNYFYNGTLASGTTQTGYTTSSLASITNDYYGTSLTATGVATSQDMVIQGTLTQLPTLSTAGATNITTTSATLAGNVSSAGTATVTANGVASILNTTTSNPTTATSGVTNTTATAVQSGAFSVSVTGLSVNTKYAYNAYATNAGGTSYGTASSFYTLANTPTTPTVGSPTSSSLNVTIGASDGNPSATTYAIYNSTTSQYVQANGSLGASAVYQTATTWGTVTVTGLNSGTSYSFYTYAQNGTNVQTVASTAASASTNSAALPGLTTTAATSISTTSATLAGNITSAGSPAVSANGVVSILYATNSNPTTATSGVTNTTATTVQSGAFSVSLTGLLVNTQYAYNAYATNASGTSYGTATYFYTLANTPTTPTVGSATVTTLSVTIGASDGNPSTTTYAIYNSTTGQYVQSNGS